MIGTRLNQHIIVAAAPAGMTDHHVILAVADNPTQWAQPYITAWVHFRQLPQAQEWWTGHYFSDLDKAVEDFIDRTAFAATDTSQKQVRVLVERYLKYLWEKQERSSTHFCQYCGFGIASSPAGWVDATPTDEGGTYDLCETAPNGKHVPGKTVQP